MLFRSTGGVTLALLSLLPQPPHARLSYRLSGMSAKTPLSIEDVLAKQKAEKEVNSKVRVVSASTRLQLTPSLSA